MRAPASPQSHRWKSQQWLMDVAVRSVGIDFDQGRIGYTGRPAAGEAGRDLAWVAANVKRYVHISPTFEVAGRRREARAREAEAAGQLVTARESHFVASLMYLSAAWPIFEDSPRLVELNELKNRCYARWGELADHHVERVEIPFRGSVLPGWFHRPAGWDGKPLPTALVCGGMDAFKEVQVSMYGDKLLERGFAVLAVDGPGQGEAPILGVKVEADNWVDAGEHMMRWLDERPDVDSERLVAMGSSFGSYWMTQVAATQPRLKGCAVALPCHEPGGHSIFNEASPTFKARYMWMAGIHDEEEFDAFAAELDLRPAASGMEVPWLCLGGEFDELSPIEHTYELAATMQGHASLVVYEGAGHGLAGSPSTMLGPDWRTFAADWLLDRANGVPDQEMSLFVTRTGATESRPHPRDTP